MEYKIIGDSCLDLTEELKQDPHFQTIPLTLQVGDVHVIDDETFDQKGFLQLVKNSEECPRTACPSPDAYRKAYEAAFAAGAEAVFVITLSGPLSGSFNSASVAKEMYEEEHGRGSRIGLVDSQSASSGQLNIALKIRELCEAGLPFEEVEREALAYRDSMKTYFVLETLDFLRKNGRLTGLKAFIATALNIKPVMGAELGTIIKLDQMRGIRKALARMAQIAVSEGGDTAGKRLIIAHCNNEARAELVREMFQSMAAFREILITNTAGVATLYAGDGGIIVTM